MLNSSQSTIKMSNFKPQIKQIVLKYHHFHSNVKQGHIEMDYFLIKKQQQQQTHLLTKPSADATISRL